MAPRFKLIADGIILNNNNQFWIPPHASHISFKNGKASLWLLLNPHPSQPDTHKSTNNRRFVKKQGNTFFLPGFRLSVGTGYCYDPICWVWRCRRCLNHIRPEGLNSEEICSRCARI